MAGLALKDQRVKRRSHPRECVDLRMMSVALSFTRFPIVEKQLPSMIRPVSAVSSILLWTFTRNSSAGQGCQFGSQRRVSKLVCGTFNNPESLAPNVVWRRTSLRVKPPKIRTQHDLLPFQCLHDRPQQLWEEGAEPIHFGLLFTRMNSWQQRTAVADDQYPVPPGPITDQRFRASSGVRGGRRYV
jgi:hypothetical protein